MVYLEGDAEACASRLTGLIEMLSIISAVAIVEPLCRAGV